MIIGWSISCFNLFCQKALESGHQFRWSCAGALLRQVEEKQDLEEAEMNGWRSVYKKHRFLDGFNKAACKKSFEIVDAILKLILDNLQWEETVENRRWSSVILDHFKMRPFGCGFVSGWEHPVFCAEALRPGSASSVFSWGVVSNWISPPFPKGRKYWKK